MNKKQLKREILASIEAHVNNEKRKKGKTLAEHVDELVEHINDDHDPWMLATHVEPIKNKKI